MQLIRLVSFQNNKQCVHDVVKLASVVYLLRKIIQEFWITKLNTMFDFNIELFDFTGVYYDPYSSNFVIITDKFLNINNTIFCL